MRCNPLAKQSAVFTAQLKAEWGDAKKSAPARFTFQRIRLNARMHGRTPDSVLLQPSQADTLLARPPAQRAGACIVSVDMAGATGVVRRYGGLGIRPYGMHRHLSANGRGHGGARRAGLRRLPRASRGRCACRELA